MKSKVVYEEEREEKEKEKKEVYNNYQNVMQTVVRSAIKNLWYCFCGLFVFRFLKKKIYNFEKNKREEMAARGGI